ncbi:hypothetical protein BD626DRAFT_36876 [Schizophyllum amplum]|uniref:BTB domain-containing protein n=1 Tax=Schizophyllum amplum TaxID=97359 RepID=A0A550CEW9_9AGAR|nr:hypothetical protein BD626DRAFT_36876 [Auriculariopsis ampla]
MYSLPPVNRSVKEGVTENNSIKLDVKARDFENLLYLFYDAPYEWLPTVVDSAIPMWESVLHLADMFDMHEVKVVALHALGRPGALADVHKIALYNEYGIARSWANSAFTRVCTRTDALTGDEIAELKPATAAVLRRAREALLRGMKLGTKAHTAERIQEVVNKNFMVSG